MATKQTTTQQPKQQLKPAQGKGKRRGPQPTNAPRTQTAPARKKQTETALAKKIGAEVILPQTSNSSLKRNVPVVASFDETAFSMMFASLYAFYANRGLMLKSEADFNDPEIVANGLGYLFNALGVAIKSGTIKVSKAPAVVLDMMNALNSKNVTFMGNAKMNFSWDVAPTFDNFPTVSINGGTWVPTIIISDNATYNSPAAVPVTNFTEDAYSATLNRLESVVQNPAAQLQDPAKYRSVLSRDVSSFARAYVYNGLTPSQAGGYYKDVELEVGITAPMLSSFAKYGATNAETRVPMKLSAYSGDAALSIGWSLHPTFNSYFNKRTPSIKCIDFEWISSTLCQMLALAINKGISSGKWEVGNYLPITFQDFRIVLRQALLNIFDSQYMLQFTGPLNFGSNDNGFVPFQVNGHSYGNQAFSTMLVPTLIRENLMALKARAFRNKKPQKSKINIMTWFPVLGRYVQDTPPVPQYIPPRGEPAVPIFAPTAQQTINLIDGSVSPGQYVNLNGTHYQTAMAVWNNALGTLNAVLAPCASIVGDAGAPGLGILFYTSVVKSAPQQTLALPTPVLKSPYADTVVNGLPKRLNREKSLGKESKVQALPPASILYETQEFTTTALPPNTEMQALFDSLIVPVIRLDTGNDDQLSLQMYQVESKEGVSSKYEGVTNPGAGGVFSRLGKLAQLCVTDIGHDSSGEYQQTLTDIAKHNNAGMLAGLLGGLAKSFLPPDAHGIVDVVADVLPF